MLPEEPVSLIFPFAKQLSISPDWHEAPTIPPTFELTHIISKSEKQFLQSSC